MLIFNVIKYTLIYHFLADLFAFYNICNVISRKITIMKSLIFTLFLTIISLTVFGNSNNGQNKEPIKMIPVKSQTVNRPQYPSRQEISCEYGEGCLFISFHYPEGVCSLSVTEIGEETQVYDFDSSTEAVIMVGELTSVDITITTEYGHTYRGTA